MERKEQEQAEEAEKLRWIERFLEEDSAESDEDGEGEDAVAAMEGVQPPPGPAAWFRGGRGKTVPLHDRNVPAGRVAFPSDPADARAALLSKREVRALAYRRQLAMDLDPGPEPADDEVCDACRTWYHLECIGIHDVAELGREEDPWYCPRCVEGNGEEDTPSSEPTFAPTDEGPTPHRPHPDPLFFQAIAMQESPLDAWRGRFPDMPTTPTRAGNVRASNVSLARSSWTDGGSARHDHPATPPSRAPPAYVRVQATTPGYERNFMQEGGSPFDPTSTPSRGFMFGAPFTTPKPGGGAVPRGTGMSTPPARHALPRPPPSGSPYRGDVVYDDTPVDRTGPRPVAPLPARKVMDSPLMGRGHARHLEPGLAESPVIRGKGKAKERVGREPADARFAYCLVRSGRDAEAEASVPCEGTRALTTTTILDAFSLVENIMGWCKSYLTREIGCGSVRWGLMQEMRRRAVVGEGRKRERKGRDITSTRLSQLGRCDTRVPALVTSLRAAAANDVQLLSLARSSSFRPIHFTTFTSLPACKNTPRMWTILHSVGGSCYEKTSITSIIAVE
ncbi:hypothetical protein EVG20_g8684 [Dentipellis fragilis]|uniref:PHD-type domain-containing protein n=1 Tax=Dentipellis fragilis TaxID=205917 RepID=A0A4Y9Y4G5_9AGAM|nr:hypothetical protein EVG20_g8684 [Dentipellis fragilis]